MELEDAIKQCEKFIKAFKEDDTKSVIGFDIQALEILLYEFKKLKWSNDRYNGGGKDTWEQKNK